MAEAAQKYQQAGPKVKSGAKEEMVYSWPYLVSIEAIAAVMIIFSLSLMSTLVNAPLRELADGTHTLNPAKAPWYFLGLQELLLHMHPALAGVIVPGAVLFLLGMIPYIDTDKRGTGIWFSTKKGLPITIFSFIYTWVIELALILIDMFWTQGMAPGQHGIKPQITQFFVKFFGTDASTVNWIGDLLVPSILMVAVPWLLVGMVKRRFKANTREVMIALYSFFLASFILLTLTSTAFRGHSMDLVWPWNLPEAH